MAYSAYTFISDLCQVASRCAGARSMLSEMEGLTDAERRCATPPSLSARLGRRAKAVPDAQAAAGPGSCQRTAKGQRGGGCGYQRLDARAGARDNARAGCDRS